MKGDYRGKKGMILMCQLKLCMYPMVLAPLHMFHPRPQWRSIHTAICTVPLLIVLWLCRAKHDSLVQDMHSMFPSDTATLAHVVLA